ncbi:MAG: hypothetical protein JOZ77_09120 [Candidatus Eremiobacteraeota bacterium]|nr:hypothetical protein [Candidatus Eremiobacteraeota bacterium]
MRFPLLIASSAIAASLVLGACSGGTGSSSLPSSGAQQIAQGHTSLIPVGLHIDAKNPCPSSKYIFCIDVSASSSGPYVCFSSDSCGSPTSPVFYAYGYIDTTKGKSAAKKISEFWEPFPGNPTEQYLVLKKAPKKASTKVKYVDYVYACTAPSSGCGSTYAIGIIPQ